MSDYNFPLQWRPYTSPKKINGVICFGEGRNRHTGLFEPYKDRETYFAYYAE